MKMILVGGLLVVLPALAVVVSLWGSSMMYPALVSLCMAALPFIASAAMLRGSSGDEGFEGH